MASEVSICNNGLIKMGEETILSLDDDVKRAKVCKEMYPELRDAVLRDHFWNFAMKRGILAPLINTPKFGFEYMFNLPADFIRLYKISDQTYITYDLAYRIEAGRILANINPLQILYTYRVEDANQMDPLFRNALSTRIAWELSKALADNDNLAARLRDEYAGFITDARTVDAQDDYAPVITAEKWLQSRLM